jgi:hypothetical protein
MYNKKESGQVIIIIAFGLVALLIFAALAVDLGAAYSARRDAQNAADAAAMAGARQIVIECNNGAAADEDQVLAQVDSLMTVNAPNATYEAYFIDSSGARLFSNQVGNVGYIPCMCGAGRAQGLEVIVHNTTDSFLAGVMGQDTLAADAEARAAYNQTIINDGEGLYPFTRRDDQPMTFGQLVKVRVSDKNEDPSSAPGNFGWLSWNGENNVPNLGESLTFPGDAPQKYYNPGTPDNNWTADHSDKTVSVGDWVQGAPGNKNGAAVRAQLDWHIAHQDVMFIPLYSAGVGQGSHYNYFVSNFAGFQLQSYNLTGQDKHMTGKFVRWTTNGSWVNVACEDETGIYSIKLIP